MRTRFLGERDSFNLTKPVTSVRIVIKEYEMEAYDRLVKLVEDVADDISKAHGGNKAAGVRVRKTMQEIKAAAQEVRVGVLNVRD